MRTTRAASLAEGTRRQVGMSLVEVLIAVAIMAVVALAILPLFSRSIRMNREGGNLTEVTNVARSGLEEYLQLDFNAPQLTIPPGSNLLRREDYWDPSARRWMPFDPGSPPFDIEAPPAGILWHRAVEVQQFAAGDLTEDGFLDNPLDGAEPRENVQLKRIHVIVQPLWNAFAMSRPTPISLEVIKAI